MTGEELFQTLAQMTPEQRKLIVIASYWESNGEGSDFEQTKDFWRCSLAKTYHNGKDIDAIVLE